MRKKSFQFRLRPVCDVNAFFTKKTLIQKNTPQQILTYHFIQI